METKSTKKQQTFSSWQILAIFMSISIIIYQWYLLFYAKTTVYTAQSTNEDVSFKLDLGPMVNDDSIPTDSLILEPKKPESKGDVAFKKIPKMEQAPKVVAKKELVLKEMPKKEQIQKTVPKQPRVKNVRPTFGDYAKIPLIPLLGNPPVNGALPLYNATHQGGDAVFALACKYPTYYFKRFVGSLRKFGYHGDVVLGVSPPAQMHPGLGQYLQQAKVVAYSFEVDCNGKDNCKLKDEFLGYPDPRPYRSFANIRYALYEYWMRYYSEQSYILILDFRDTFFQADPFASFGYPVSNRIPKYDLQVYAENYKVKNIGICVYNSGWVGECFGDRALQAIKHLPVICSGSTLGSYPAMRHYIKTMLKSMDEVQCWRRKQIESDQGYQNYLYHNGFFNTKDGNATMNMQGYGVVNTIGAMNGYRVPADQKGPLDTFWKIRDSEGFVLNYDGNRSACVHQWDRFEDELRRFVDSGKLYDR